MSNMNGNASIIAPETPHCGVCKRTGAKWLLKSGDKEMPVHKPCGTRVAQMAPAGTAAKVVPSDALRAEWQERDATAAAQSFWKDKFQEAERKRDAKAAKLNGANIPAAPAQLSG